MLAAAPNGLVLLIGHSHVAAVEEAWREREARGVAPFPLQTVSFVGKLAGRLEKVGGEARLGAGLSGLIVSALQATRPALVVAAFWGGQHFPLSAANNPRRFDFLAPGDDTACDPQAELAPYDLVEAFLAREFVDVTLMIAAVRAACAAPILLIPAPPPMRDFVALPLRTSDRAVDAEIDRYGVAPPALRRKVWRVCDLIYKQIAAQTGVRLAPTAPGVTDAEGFRRPQFYGRDWIHANAGWGALVLDQIGGALRSEMGR